jgi:hypothetical protein
VQAADQYIADEHRNTAIIQRDAPWTKDPATPKQIALLTKFGEPISPDMTKGEAAQRISILLEKRQKPAEQCAA